MRNFFIVHFFEFHVNEFVKLLLGLIPYIHYTLAYNDTMLHKVTKAQRLSLEYFPLIPSLTIAG